MAIKNLNIMGMKKSRIQVIENELLRRWDSEDILSSIQDYAFVCDLCSKQQHDWTLGGKSDH